MRFTRLIGALLATVLLGGLGLVSAGSASATPTTDTASRVSVADNGVAERRAVKVTMNAKQKGRQVLLVGKVKPRKGPVILQRANAYRSSGGDFKCRKFGVYKKLGTNKQARFKSFAPGRPGAGYCYQARVGSSKSAVYRITRTRA